MAGGQWWIYAILGVVIVILGYLLFQCHKPPTVGQRQIPPPPLPDMEGSFTFRVDQNMDASKLFLMKTPGTTNFPSIFSNPAEREQAKQQARKFFKEQYGFSDVFLNVAMVELRVNPVAGYSAEGHGLITDGGFVVPIPKGTVLKGKYGGKDGVVLKQQAVVPWGYYIFGGYKIEYRGTCPMRTFPTYDGNYSAIDCAITVVQAPAGSKLAGLDGTAIGIYKNTMLQGGNNNIKIRNVLTLPQ